MNSFKNYKTPTRYRKKFCTSSDVLTFLPNWSATEQWVLQSFSHSDMPFPVSDKCCPDNIRFVLPRSWQGSVFPYLLKRSSAETAIDFDIPAVLPAPAQLLLFVCQFHCRFQQQWQILKPKQLLWQPFPIFRVAENVFCIYPNWPFRIEVYTILHHREIWLFG